jgi:hypothetical protein
MLLPALLLCCLACKDEPETVKDIPFDKTKWSAKADDGSYAYRKQMVNDLLNNYKWSGLTKDSVIRMLGKPDDTPEGTLMYDYEREAFLGGLGTSIEAIVFELAPDSTVRLARKNDGGWD